MDWRGFELHPETPVGGVPLTRLFPANRIAGMHAHLQSMATRFGLPPLHLSLHLPNTRRALAVAEWARAQHQQDPLRRALMKAHWLEGRDIESDATLMEVAKSVGLDPEGARQAADDPRWLAEVDAIRLEATEAGVSGIPALFIGEYPIVGAQPYEVLERALMRAGAQRRN